MFVFNHWYFILIPFLQNNIPFKKLPVRSRAIHCASDIPVQKGNSFIELVLFMNYPQLTLLGDNIMKAPDRIQWYIHIACLDIYFESWSIVLDGVDRVFASEMASNLQVPGGQSTFLLSLSEEPQVIMQKRGVVVKVWKYPGHPDNLRPDPASFTTINEVVEDILASLDERNKDNVRNKSKDQLDEFHFGWGQGIRNYYKLWHNKSLVRSTGKEHPNDASAVIIEEVWKKLQETEYDDSKAVSNTLSLKWHVDKKCLELSWGRGRTLVIERIKLDFAEKIASISKANLIQTKNHFQHPSVMPQVIQSTKRVKLSLWKYADARPGGNRHS